MHKFSVMRTIFFNSILLLLIFYSGNTVCQNAERIITLMKEQEGAWNRGDLNGFMSYYYHSDSLMFVGKKGVTKGWEATLERYQKSYPDKSSMGELEFTIVKTEELSKDCFYVIGQWNLKRENPVGGYFTLVWRKFKEGWKIVYDHTS